MAMMFDNSVYTKKEIREMINSWEIMTAVKIALEDDRVVLILLDLLKDKDKVTKTRSLLALNEILKRANEKTRVTIIKYGLDEIITILKDKDEDISLKAARVLGQLIEKFPLRERELSKILDAIVPLIKKSHHELTLLEITELIENVKILHPSRNLRSRIMGFISSKNPRIKAMGLRLLLNLFIYAGDTKSLKFLLSEASDLLSSESDDVPLVEFCLNTIQDAFKLPLNEDIIDEVSKVLTKIKNLSTQSKDFAIRMKARETLEIIEKVIYEYYRLNPEAAKRKISKLLLDGFIYEAIDLAIAVRDKYILEWLHEGIHTRPELSSRFIPSIPILPSSQKQGQKQKIMLPSLNELRSPKRTPEVTLESAKSLSKIIEEENIQALLNLLKSDPGIIDEISKMLKSEKPEERMDILWALYEVSSNLNRAELTVIFPLIPDLFDILISGNPWAKSRAAKILAILASRAGYDEIVTKSLELLNSNPIPALEFFSYYFTYVWDEKRAIPVLDFLKKSFEDRDLQFDVLLTLEAIVSKAPPDRIELLVPFIPRLKQLERSGTKESQKIAIRILERILKES
ncbi:hypothetical protein [Thermococcus sp.]